MHIIPESICDVDSQMPSLVAEFLSDDTEHDEGDDEDRSRRDERQEQADCRLQEENHDVEKARGQDDR